MGLLLHILVIFVAENFIVNCRGRNVCVYGMLGERRVWGHECGEKSNKWKFVKAQKALNYLLLPSSSFSRYRFVGFVGTRINIHSVDSLFCQMNMLLLLYVCAAFNIWNFMLIEYESRFSAPSSFGFERRFSAPLLLHRLNT